MGGPDRLLRVVIFAVIVLLYWQGIIEGTLGFVLLILGGISLLTSIVSLCPLYTLFGINTCKLKK